MQNYNQDRILDGIRPQLVNIKEKDNRISFFCPFCQSTGIKSNGKRWHPSRRKAYILMNQESGYEFYVFYCHNTNCKSKLLSTSIKGGLSLENFSRHILGGKAQKCNSASRCSVSTERTSIPVTHPSRKPTGDSQSKRGESNVTVLPRADRSHMAGKGGHIEQQLKQRREARKSYWDRI